MPPHTRSNWPSQRHGTISGTPDPDVLEPPLSVCPPVPPPPPPGLVVAAVSWLCVLLLLVCFFCFFCCLLLAFKSVVVIGCALVVAPPSPLPRKVLWRGEAEGTDTEADREEEGEDAK